jgi:hypothetical protein
VTVRTTVSPGAVTVVAGRVAVRAGGFSDPSVPALVIASATVPPPPSPHPATARQAVTSRSAAAVAQRMTGRGSMTFRKLPQRNGEVNADPEGHPGEERLGPGALRRP